jgi:hypothetical protein
MVPARGLSMPFGRGDQFEQVPDIAGPITVVMGEKVGHDPPR